MESMTNGVVRLSFQAEYRTLVETPVSVCDTHRPPLGQVTMLVDKFQVDSPDVEYGADHIASQYNYANTKVDRDANGKWIVKPIQSKYEFRTSTKLPKLG